MFTIRIALVILCSAFGACQVAPQIDLAKELTTRPPAYPFVRGDSFIQALLRYASENEIPLGVEWIADKSSSNPVDATFTGSILDGLKTLTEHYPAYGFRIYDGMVRVFPKSLADNRSGYLNIVIRHFEVKDHPVSYASFKLKGLVQGIIDPPMPPIMNSSKTKGRGVAGHVTSGLGDKNIALTMDNATVEQILDRLLQYSQLKVWVVTYPADPNVRMGYYRRTMSLYAKEQSPSDASQPEWNLLVWGADPVTGGMNPEWHKLPKETIPQ